METQNGREMKIIMMTSSLAKRNLFQLMSLLCKANTIHLTMFLYMWLVSNYGNFYPFLSLSLLLCPAISFYWHSELNLTALFSLLNFDLTEMIF